MSKPPNSYKQENEKKAHSQEKHHSIPSSAPLSPSRPPEQERTRVSTKSREMATIHEIELALQNNNQKGKEETRVSTRTQEMAILLKNEEKPTLQPEALDKSTQVSKKSQELAAVYEEDEGEDVLESLEGFDDDSSPISSTVEEVLRSFSPTTPILRPEPLYESGRFENKLVNELPSPSEERKNNPLPFKTAPDIAQKRKLSDDELQRLTDDAPTIDEGGLAPFPTSSVNLDQEGNPSGDALHQDAANEPITDEQVPVFDLDSSASHEQLPLTILDKEKNISENNPSRFVDDALTISENVPNIVFEEYQTIENIKPSNFSLWIILALFCAFCIAGMILWLFLSSPT